MARTPSLIDDRELNDNLFRFEPGSSNEGVSLPHRSSLPNHTSLPKPRSQAGVLEEAEFAGEARFNERRRSGSLEPRDTQNLTYDEWKNKFAPPSMTAQVYSTHLRAELDEARERIQELEKLLAIINQTANKQGECVKSHTSTKRKAKMDAAGSEDDLEVAREPQVRLRKLKEAARAVTDEYSWITEASHGPAGKKMDDLRKLLE